MYENRGGKIWKDNYHLLTQSTGMGKEEEKRNAGPGKREREKGDFYFKSMSTIKLCIYEKFKPMCMYTKKFFLNREI